MLRCRREDRRWHIRRRILLLPNRFCSPTWLGGVSGDRSYRENQQNQHGNGRIRKLRHALHQAGIKTAAIGNADIWPDIQDRSAGVLAADSRGLIDVGMLSAGAGPEIIGASKKEDGGLVANVPALLDAINKALPKADFVVVNFGPSTALDNSRPEISDKRYNVDKAIGMRDLNSLIASLLPHAESGEFRLILVSLSPPILTGWTVLPPLIVYPSLGSGLLTSPTTRTPGLIAASDFAPTVLELLRGARSQWDGRPACNCPACPDFLEKRGALGR